VLIFVFHIFKCLYEMCMFSNFKMNRLGIGRGQNNNIIFKHLFFATFQMFFFFFKYNVAVQECDHHIQKKLIGEII